MILTHEQLYKSNNVSCSGGIRLGKNGEIILITAEGSVYQDQLSLDKRSCEFRGQGLVGDQTWSNPCNSRLRQELLAGNSVPLYEKIAVDEYELLGNYKIEGSIYTATEPGEDGIDRTVFVFPLIRV